MGLQDVVSNTGYELIKEVDNITKPPIKDWLMGLFDSKVQVNKIESLINKGKKERCFIQKYVETKRATFSNDSAILSFSSLSARLSSNIVFFTFFTLYAQNIPQSSVILATFFTTVMLSGITNPVILLNKKNDHSIIHVVIISLNVFADGMPELSKRSLLGFTCGKRVLGLVI